MDEITGRIISEDLLIPLTIMTSLTNKASHFLWTIFPPGSRIELFFRSLYHKIGATSLFTNYLMQRSSKQYSTWLAAQNEYLSSQIASQNFIQEVTFFLELEDNTLLAALPTIKSIIAQSNHSWRLIIMGDDVIIQGQLPDIKNDARVGLISKPKRNLAEFIANCKTPFFVVCRPGDIFFNTFIDIFQQAIQNNPGRDVYYSDAETVGIDSHKRVPVFKPTKYSPELHLSTNYLSRAIISTHSAKSYLEQVAFIGGLQSQEWELLLLLGKESMNFCQIPHVLVTLSSENEIGDSDRKALIQRLLRRKGLDVSVPKIEGNRTAIKFKSEQPLISIIIPTKNNFQKLKTLLDSLFTLTDYPAYEIILVDTGSTDQRIFGYYEDLMRSKSVQMLRYDQSFNYSRVNNLGAKRAKGELLLFLNNDMQVLDKDWLSELSQWALRDEIGVVGTKLIHPNGRIQHIGIVIGMQGFIGHLYRNAPKHYWGLMGSSDWYRNVSAVTGACQMIRKDLFWELGGFDEQYELVTGDIILCLKALKLGYRNLYTPHGTLLHHEGASRGYQTPVEDILRGYEEMDEILRNGDPYFSPNLTLEPIPRCEMDSWIPGHRSQKYLERKNYYLAHRSKIGQG